MCKVAKLDIDELEYLTIGGAVDYVHEYADSLNAESSSSSSAPGVRDATPEEIANF